MNEPKKRGRPPKPAAERRRHNQTFRCNDDMLSLLQAAADANQRSLSEEVEKRLEDSFTKAVISKVIEEAQDAYAVQAIHSTLEELQEELGHPYAIPVSIYMGQGFTEIHKKIRAETPTEIWFEDPDRMKEAAEHMHKRVDSLFANWNLITYRTTMWSTFQKYMSNIFRKKADGTYIQREAKSRALREADEASTKA